MPILPQRQVRALLYESENILFTVYIRLLNLYIHIMLGYKVLARSLSYYYFEYPFQIRASPVV